MNGMFKKKYKYSMLKKTQQRSIRTHNTILNSRPLYLLKCYFLGKRLQPRTPIDPNTPYPLPITQHFFPKRALSLSLSRRQRPVATSTCLAGQASEPFSRQKDVGRDGTECEWGLGIYYLALAGKENNLDKSAMPSSFPLFYSVFTVHVTNQ